MRVAAEVLEYRKREDLKHKRWSISAKKKDVVQKDIVQVKNPKSGHYVKIDRAVGKIIAHKSSEGPYKNVPIARNTNK